MPASTAGHPCDRARQRQSALPEPGRQVVHDAARLQHDRRARRVRGAGRAHGLRQVDDAQPDHRTRAPVERAGARHGPAGLRHRSAHRLRLPERCAVPVAQRHRQRRRRAALSRPLQEARPMPPPATGWAASASPGSRTTIRTSSPAACASASPWPRPSSTSRKSC